ncbi:hypothetical protein DL95DRAFT_418763 [Leptodontidium sp. 2 PMI_412]|nr:hypothetical protein DL95DRAFT_418763 [Leptodontidium sp. 2 PMI_412]
MTKYDSQMEGRIRMAVAFKQKTPLAKPSKIAKYFVVPLRLFNARRAGRLPQHTKGGHNKALSKEQDDGLREYISFLIYIGHQATKSSIRAGANSILKASGSTGTLNSLSGQTDGSNATANAQERKAATKKEDLAEHFLEFYDTMIKYGLTAADLYNMDETGFRIGFIWQI